MMNGPNAIPRPQGLSETGPSPLVSLREVSKAYRSGDIETRVFENVSLQIGAGEFVVVLGPSGSGKTTLLNLIGAMDKATSGRIRVDATELTALDARALSEFRRHRVGFVFQFYNLLPTLTAFENIAVVLEMLRWPHGRVHQRVFELLEGVGLAGKAQKFPEQLSGGEQQRVSIARALAKDPLLVLADEPTGNLDEDTGFQIVDLMKKMNVERKTTFVVVTHNPKLEKYADRRVRFHHGTVLAG